VLFLIALIPALVYYFVPAQFEREKKPTEILLEMQKRGVRSERITTIEPTQIINEMGFGECVKISLKAMSFLGTEVKPVGVVSESLIFLQSILGPIQAALLALAIRRKFMR
jgi:hypothetical protein